MSIKTNIADKYIFKNANIYFPINRKMLKGNILVKNGIIEDINYNGNSEGYVVLDCADKIICPGFLDLRSHFGEPGLDDVESVDSGSKAALAGGYTKVCTLPNTYPVIDNLESLESLFKKSQNLDIDIYPIGSITNNLDGTELSEIGLMAKEGIVAISDAHKSIDNAQVMRNALEYAKMFNLPVISHAENISLANEGIANESEFSTQKGLPSNPFISETIGIFRDLEIANYVGGRIHLSHISSSKSIPLIQKYKDMGLLVTAELTPHHIGLTETELNDFNAFYKISPPLRSEKDCLGLIEGLKNGVIDCISSDHFPRKIEDKESDLLNSKSGVIGLESAFAFSNQILSNHDFKIEDVIDLFTIRPSKVFGIDLEPIEKNFLANFIVLDPEVEWIFEKKNIYSKSKNSALLGKKMRGKVEMVVAKNKIHTI